jgi:phosphoglycerol transferase MdoB-like AlkP superfamily enzyme
VSSPFDTSNGRPALARFRPLNLLVVIYIAIGAALRVVLWWEFGRGQHVEWATLSWILPAGVVADLLQCMDLLVPFAIFLWLTPDHWYKSRTLRALLFTGTGLFVFACSFLAIVEYFFFQEFDARLNLVAVDYLMYPTEVIGDIRSEYPVVTVALACAVFALSMLVLLRGTLLRGTARRTQFNQRSSAFSAFAAALVATIIAPVGYAPALSDNRVANEIAANGTSTFLSALRTNEIDYHAHYASHDAAANLRALSTQLAEGGGTFTRLSEGRVNRAFAGTPKGLGKLNVVVIASESFGAEFSKLYGSEHDWTPEFDAFARRGVWFSHMYASGTRTVRGLEAIATSLPPIPSVSVVRRPNNENIANWGSVMKRHGYDASFLYGGYGYFDNMNYFFSHNGFEVRDRRDIPKPVRFENMWGVSDEDLFDMALSHFDALNRTGRPFFSIIMTTSNHKPFTFRVGVPGVKPSGGGRESGVRYADFAQGYFLREAQKHAWFDNTLFVVVADHGARVYGRAEIPLKSYEIPMLFYAPKHLTPGVVDTLTTQIDIAPTVLGLLGLPYEAPFFGQDALHASTQHRIAFFSHNHDVALYEDGTLAILGLGKSIQDVAYDRVTDTYHPVPPQPRLNNLAVAYYQTAYELFHAHRYD